MLNSIICVDKRLELELGMAAKYMYDKCPFYTGNMIFRSLLQPLSRQFCMDALLLV